MIEYVKVLRIDHWLKNVFIFFGHLVALALLPAEVPQNTATVVLRMFLSLIPACVIASANYIVNEILDAPFDRMHPTKRFRPVPSGKVKLSVLWTLMGVLIVAAFVLAAITVTGLTACAKKSDHASFASAEEAVSALIDAGRASMPTVPR